MGVSNRQFTGFPAEVREKLIAERNEKIIRLVLVDKVPREAVAARLGVSKLTVTSLVSAKRRELRQKEGVS